MPEREGPSQATLTPSHGDAHQSPPSNMVTPTHALQTPRPTDVYSRSAGGWGGVEDVETHTKLSQRRLAIYDRVYGQILFPPVIRLFIDSPQVQRLRDLKQLGNGHYIYPSATHTRFEHSLGVSHLAMAFLKQILTNHAEEPGLGEHVRPILSHDGSKDMQKDIWCVGIAGLCHDLGHGPLSHMFESYVNSVREREGKKKWSHERTSISMLRTIWDSKREELESFDLGEEDFEFVKLMINGLKPGEPWPTNVGRSADLRFMTDIIANKRSGLDVDKIDYLQRDSLSCFGTPALVSLDRLFQGACVMRDESGETQICYQSKLEGSVGEIFQVRTRLYKIVYQHRVTCVMDQMVKDAFVLADKHFKISFAGKQYRLSECVDEPGAYVQTGDWIVNAILRSHEEGLSSAQEIFERTQNRRIYTTIGTSVSVSNETRFSQEAFIRQIENEDLKQRLQAWNKLHDGCPALELIQTKFTKVAGDMELLDPMTAIRFYNPRHGAEAKPYLLSNNQLTMSAGSPSQPTDAEQTSIVICRMPLTVADLNALSNTFEKVSIYQGALSAANRSVSPTVMRERSSSRPTMQHCLSQQQVSPLSQQEQRPLRANPKRDREEAEAQEGWCGQDRFGATKTDMTTPPAPALPSGMRKKHQDQHVKHGKDGQDGSTASKNENLIVPPPPRLILQQQQHQQPLSQGMEPRQSSKSSKPARGDSGAGERDGDVDDVGLPMHPLSQLDNNSRSNADEPDIRIDFSNTSNSNLPVGGGAHHTWHEDTDEGTHLGPPTPDAPSPDIEAKRRKVEIADPSPSEKK